MRAVRGHAGDQIGALRIAARFFDRSIDTKAFKRGIDAYNNPDFYRQLGKDPEQIVRDALDVWGELPAAFSTTCFQRLIGLNAYTQ